MLVDHFSRHFRYLRLSLTEKCNFKCAYCLPNGYKGPSIGTALELREIVNLGTAFKDLGIEKIRLTGGEPTLRPDLLSVIRALKDLVGIKQVALTTNGFRLEQDLERLRDAGLDSLNISLDSLQDEKFQSICGADKCSSIRRSLERALNLGFRHVKLNCVLLKGINDDEFDDFLAFVKTRPVSIRFIELMRTGMNKDYFERHHLPVREFEERLQSWGWVRKASDLVGGPAKEFEHRDSLGRVGFISPYNRDFCSSCNRLRVSSVGGLRLCLFGRGDVSLRPLLQRSEDLEHLKDEITSALKIKPQGHRLNEGQFGDMQSLSAIGG